MANDPLQNVTVAQYYPRTIQDFTEIKEIGEAEQFLFDSYAKMELDKIKANQYIMTADADGLGAFESVLGIVSKPAETVAFRRERLLLRYSMNPPFTENWLRAKLDSIIGVGRYTMDVNNATYTLTIEASAADQAWFEEIGIMVNRTKPANIIFINKPLVGEKIIVNETAGYSTINWNYKLGTTWQLGQKPFSSIIDVGDIKAATTLSIDANLTAALAANVASQIANVLVNDSYIISSFSIKNNTADVATIEYTVPVTSGITEIRNVKFRNSGSAILTNSPVYVPVITDIVMKHKITVKEGVS